MKRRQFLKHVGAASLAAPVFTAIQVRAATATVATSRTFLSRLQPAATGGGFELPDYWVWCGAPIRGEDGLYHLFASRVPKEVPFHPHWLFRSEIVRAESEKPVGPYRYAEVALPPRGGDFFDARSTHNPHIRKVGDTFLLLYMGTNYDGPHTLAAESRGLALASLPRYLGAQTDRAGDEQERARPMETP